MTPASQMTLLPGASSAATVRSSAACSPGASVSGIIGFPSAAAVPADEHRTASAPYAYVCWGSVPVFVNSACTTNDSPGAAWSTSDDNSMFQLPCDGSSGAPGSVPGGITVTATGG